MIQPCYLCKENRTAVVKVLSDDRYTDIAWTLCDKHMIEVWKHLVDWLSTKRYEAVKVGTLQEDYI